jgi:hypothetical protein
MDACPLLVSIGARGERSPMISMNMLTKAEDNKNKRKTVAPTLLLV